MGKVKKRVCLGDWGINSYGFRLLGSGGDLESFKQNPVMLYFHADEKVIGQWTDIELTDEGLFAVTDFDEDDALGKDIARKVEAGYIKMASMGVVPLEFSDAPELKAPGQQYPTVTKWKLREGSIVPFGSNGRALVQLYDGDGKAIAMGDSSQLIRLMDSQGFVPTTPINDSDMKNLLKLLNLADNAGEADAMAAVTKVLADKAAADGQVRTLTDRITAMETAQKEAQKKESGILLAAAQADGRIEAGQVPAYEKLFELDFESARITLAAIPVRQGVAGQVQQGQQATATELSDLIKLSWDDLDKSGKLLRLKELNNDQYREKFKTKFGKFPA